jgi:adenosine deaminase
MGAWLARARVAISTDDPGVFMCTLSGEYAKAAAAFGLGRERVAALARAAFDYAFLPAEEKAALVEGLGPFGV